MSKGTRRAPGYVVVLALSLVGCGGGGGGFTAPPPPNVTVAVSPPSATLVTSGTQQFTATVTGASNTAVTWQVNGTTGGNATVGMITAGGLYTAPQVPPASGPVTVRATSIADPTKSDSASVTVNNPVPTTTSISPTALDAGTGNTTLTVNGSGFNPQSTAQLGGTNLATTFVNSGQLTATLTSANLSLAGTFAVTVATPTPGGGTSGSQNLQVLFVISVSPPSATPLTGSAQQFTATVAGAADTTVAWTIDGAGSGNATVGTIGATGLYTAPAVLPAPAGLTVRATSSADNTKSASAAVTITSIIEDWPRYRRDLANTGRSLETIIHSGNASTLKKKWQFTVDECCGTTAPNHRISASPAVATVGGVLTVYVGAWSGFFYAINAETGAQIWRFEVDRNPSPSATKCTPSTRCRIASSPAVDNGVVYFGAEDATLYAVNALTGALVWKRQLDDPENGAEIWGSPAVYNGLVYIGVASHSSAPCVAGKMFGLNVADGTIAWQFDAVVQSTCPSGICLGAGIWSSAAIDTEFDTLFIGTGNPGISCVPATAKATEEYSDGILGLNLASGTLKSFYRTNANDTTDSGDVGATPVLHQIQSVNECTSTTTTTSWLTVASKDQQVWTGERDANGMPLATSLALDDGGQAIATTGTRPYSQTASCGTGNLKQSSIDLFQPTSNGHLYRFRQAFDGTTAQTAKIPINISGGCATPGACPLFSAPASTNDMLFFGGGEGNFYGYKHDGTKIYSFGTLGLVPGGPAISNGRIYFGSYDGNVYCLSLNGE